MQNMLRVTAPTEEIVTLAEAKEHLRVHHGKEDRLIQSYIDGVFDVLDGYTGQLGRALAPQRWTLSLDCMPARGFIRLPLVPFVSVHEITYDDEADAAQTLDPDLYKVKRDEGFGVVAPALNATWPAFRELRITYDCGVAAGAAESRAARVKPAMLLWIADLYDNRAAQVESRMIFENPALRRLLEPMRVRSWQ